MNLANLKIISGGQTGVDRGALEAASLMASMGLAGWGGYAPKDYRSEDGEIPEPYRSKMKKSFGGYKERTVQNIQAAHGTVIVYTKASQIVNRGGTQMTLQRAWKEGRAVLPLFLHATGGIMTSVTLLVTWLQHLYGVGDAFLIERGDYVIVNFAGPRESKAPGIQELTCDVVGNALEVIRAEA